MRHHTYVLSSATALYLLTDSLGRKVKTLGTGGRSGCLLVEGVVHCSEREENLDGEKRRQTGRGGSLPTPRTDLTPTMFTLLPLELFMALPGNSLQTHFLRQKCLQNLTFHFCVQQKRPTNSPVCYFREGFLTFFFSFLSCFTVKGKQRQEKTQLLRLKKEREGERLDLPDTQDKKLSYYWGMS